MAARLELTERLAAIVATQEQIASIRLDLNAVMQLVVERAQELADADGAVVELVREEEIHYRTAAGTLVPHTGTVFDIEGSLSGLAIQKRQVLKTDDAWNDPRVNVEISKATGSRSIIVVPLIHGDEPVGVLKVVSTRTSAFTDLDAYSLQMIAGLIAAAMSSAREHERTASSEQRFHLLFERNLAGAFWSTTDGRLVEANAALLTMLGFESKDDYVHSPAWGLYENREAREKMIDAARRDKQLHRFAVQLKRKDGTLIDVVMNVDLVPGEGETFLLGTILPAGA